jgi:hypothetical protein
MFISLFRSYLNGRFLIQNVIVFRGQPIGANEYSLLGILAFSSGLPALCAFLVMLGSGFSSLFGSFKSDVEAYHIQQVVKTASLLSIPLNFGYATKVYAGCALLKPPLVEQGAWFVVDGIYAVPNESKIVGQTDVWDVFYNTYSSWGQGNRSIWVMDATCKIEGKSPWELVESHK